MASISSSPSLLAAAVALKLVDARTGKSMLFDCFDEADHAGIDLRYALADRGSYSVSLLSTVDFGEPVVMIRAKGEKALECRPSPFPIDEDGYVVEYRIRENGKWQQPFKYAYGFVQLEASVNMGGATRAFHTKEIPCSCTIPNLKRHVVGMLDALLGSDLADAMALMTVKGDDGASVEDATSEDGSSSIEVFVSHADSVLSLVEEAMPALKLKPRTRTRESWATVDPKRARRIGRAEMEWLGRNPDSIRIEKGLLFKKHHATWSVSKIQTAMPKVSLDVPENVAVLGLLADVARVSGLFASTLRAGIEGLASSKEKLLAISIDDGCLPSLVIIDAQIEKAWPRIDAAEEVQRRARRELMVLERAWGLEPPKKYVLPRRSKVFQEVCHYAMVYKAMIEWFEYGRLDLERESLMLEVRSMSRLYELFCLAKIIDKYLREGFNAFPPEQVRYSLSYRHFGNERRVANKYGFSKGSLNVNLWYQAVFYSDAREEGGLDIHRTTRWFDGLRSRESFWTPDFVLRQANFNGCDRVIVLDSKYTEPRFCRERGYYEKCIGKYKHDSARHGGRPVDSMWLLAGRGSAGDGWSTPLGSWAVASGLLPDGVCVLSPFVDELDQALPSVACIPDQGREDSKSAKADEAEAVLGAALADVAVETVSSKESSKFQAKTMEYDQGPRARESEQLEDVITLLSDLAASSLYHDFLTDGRESQRRFGVSHPVCRKRQPTGRDRKLYTKEAVQIGEEHYYLYKVWRPDQLNRLKRTHLKLQS